MAEFRLTEISLFLILQLHFTAVHSATSFASLRVSEGDVVTLPCDSPPEHCAHKTWLFSRNSKEMTLVVGGKIVQTRFARAKAARLIFTKHCSLVMTNVTAEDAGQYVCKQAGSLHRMPMYATIALSVEKSLPFFYARRGAEVSLPCGVVNAHQDQCIRTNWLFSRHLWDPRPELVSTGKTAHAKSGRASVADDCSLVIKNISHLDAGRYFCQEDASPVLEAGAHLTVVHMIESMGDSKTEFSCWVSTSRQCTLMVFWRHADGSWKDVPGFSGMHGVPCSSTVMFANGQVNKEKLKCEVTDASGKVQTFDFIPKSSGSGR